jgi:hypothetical protein
MNKRVTYFEPFYSFCKPAFSKKISQDRNTLYWILERSDEKLSSLTQIRSKSKPESYSLGIKLIRKKVTSCLVDLELGIFSWLDNPFTPPHSPIDIKEMCIDLLEPIFDSNDVFMTTVNVPCIIKEPSPLKTTVNVSIKRKADSLPLIKRLRQDSGFEDCFV